MKIQNGYLVDLAYTLAGPEGEPLESSEESGPLEYVHGENELPPALEEALTGRGVGEEVEVSFGPGEAFGEYNPDGLVTVPRSDFPDDADFEAGEWITVTVQDDDSGSEEEEMEMRVVETSAESIVLDANHPLADQAVTFSVKVLRVREAE